MNQNQRVGSRQHLPSDLWPLANWKCIFFPWTLLAASILYVEYFNGAVDSLLWRMDLDSANTQCIKIKGLCFNEDLCIFFFFEMIKQQTNKLQKKQLLACGFSPPLWLQPPIDFYLWKSQSVKTIQSRAKNTEEIRQFALINENIPWFVGTQRRP